MILQKFCWFWRCSIFTRVKNVNILPWNRHILPCRGTYRSGRKKFISQFSTDHISAIYSIPFRLPQEPRTVVQYGMEGGLVCRSIWLSTHQAVIAPHSLPPLWVVRSSQGVGGWPHGKGHDTLRHTIDQTFPRDITLLRFKQFQFFLIQK